MSATLVTPKTLSGGEIITHLINATDGEGLHFDGAAGYIDIPTVPDLGTKFSMEFIAQADSWGSANNYLVDFGTSGRFAIASFSSISYNLGVFDGTTWFSFGVKVLDDLKVHHLTVTIDGTAAILYDNGNQVGTATITTPTLDACTDAAIASKFDGSSSWFDGTMYRARLWNKTLSQAEVTASYENATVPFADQWGVQTNKITGAVDKNWGTAQADTGNDATDRATFNTNYVWNTYLTPTDISVASNVLTFTAVPGVGIYFPTTQTAGKRYRITLATGTISGTFKVQNYNGSAFVDAGTLTASSTNVIEWVAPTGTTDYVFVLATSTGTIQLNAASVSTELVAAGVVADYDLAFANPSPSPNGQSLMVRDRASAADGTSSTAGVVQVTPIEQLNAKALSIGTTAGTPADGELMINGAGIIYDGSARFEIGKDFLLGQASGATVYMRRTTGDTVSLLGQLQFGNTNINANVADIAAYQGGQTDSGELRFLTAATGSPVATRLTIDSAGNVGIGDTAPSSLLEVTAASNPRMSLFRKDADINNTERIGDIHFQGSDVGTAATRKTSAIIRGMADGDWNAVNDYQQPSSLNFYTQSASSTVDGLGSPRLTISSAGDVTFATGNIKSGVDVNIYADDVKTLEMWNSGGVPQTKVHGTFRAEALGTFVAGVVDSTGPLKSNLLTNSGFDVWSNSTLLEATSGAAPVTDGANSALTNNKLTNGGFDSDASSWSGLDATLASVAGGKTGNCLQVTRTGAGFNYAQQDGTALVVGKLYQLSAYVTSGSSGDEAFQMYSHGSQGYGSGIKGTSSSSWVLYTTVFEATTTSATMIVGKESATAGTMLFDTVCLYEVTPGCVAADALACDGWAKESSLDIWRQHDDGGTNTKDGSFYSLKTTAGSASEWLYWPAGRDSAADNYQRFAGRTVTFGAWVKTSTASHARVRIQSGAANASGFHTGGGGWEWLEVTQTVGATPTSFYVEFLMDIDGATAYFSQPMLVFGSAIGSGNYSRPKGEVVNCEKLIRIQNNVSPVAADDKILNLEAMSSGKIPKGCKAISFSSSVLNSSVANDNGISWGSTASEWRGAPNYPTVNNLSSTGFGVLPCDSNGDIYQMVTEAGATLSELYQDVTQVELR